MSEKTKPATLEDVPVEVRAQIYSHLNVRDRMAVRRTNSLLRDDIDLFMGHNIHLNCGTNSAKFEFLKRIRINGLYDSILFYHKVDEDTISPAESSARDHDRFKVRYHLLKNNQKHLKRLLIRGGGSEEDFLDTLHLTFACPNLVKLIMDLRFSTEGTSDFNGVLSYYAQFAATYSLPEVRIMPKLEYFDIKVNEGNMCGLSHFETTLQCLTNCDYLKELHITIPASCSILFLFPVFKIFKDFRKLKGFSISLNGVVGPQRQEYKAFKTEFIESVEEFSGALKNVETLLFEFRPIRAEWAMRLIEEIGRSLWFLPLVEKAKNLKNLIIKGYEFSEISFLPPIKCLKSMKITLSCDSRRVISFANFANNFPALEEFFLDIEYNKSVERNYFIRDLEDLPTSIRKLSLILFCIRKRDWQFLLKLKKLEQIKGLIISSKYQREITDKLSNLSSIKEIDLKILPHRRRFIWF